MQKKKQTKPIKKIIILTILAILLLLLIFAEDIIKLTNKNKINLAENTPNEAIEVEPNIPVLSAGMIPIKWENDHFVITTQEDKDWYDYKNGKPAYIMLNDGYYQSELIRDMTSKELAENSVGNDALVVPDVPDNNPTILMWIPRFAINNNTNEIKYIKNVETAEEDWTIPEIFTYRQEDETKPDFLLTGIWFEIDVDTNYTNKINQMNSENSIYGFIKNTIAVSSNQSTQNEIQQYIANVVGAPFAGIPEGHDTTVPLTLTDITNPNRIILKIINQNNQEPIKAKASYNKDTGLIQIDVTYSQYGIAKILYEDTQELKLTKNGNKATATSEGLDIKYGTAKLTIIDNQGNLKELELAITSKVYVTLYTDGTLAFSKIQNPLPEKGTPIEKYSDISESHYEPYTTPWNSKSRTIARVEIVDEIAPRSTACWFTDFRNLTEIKNMNNLNTANVTNMKWMFSQCEGLTNLDVSSFDTSKVTDMEAMFSYCQGLTNLDLSNFNTNNVTNMFCMFQYCDKLTNLDASKFNTSRVTNMERMFGWCSKLNDLDISNFDTANVTNMNGMFRECNSLSNIDLSVLDTSNVMYMNSMFYGCNALTNLNLGNFDTSKVTNMNSMFFNCKNLTSLNLSSFDTSNVTNITSIFEACSSLSQITFGKNWDKEITLPTLTKPCIGWYSDADFTNKVAEAGANYTPTGPITIYANVPPDIFVKLYTDGTLAFCSNNSQIPFKELSQDYGNIGGQDYSYGNTPWYNQKGSIATVTFVDKIYPISTARWFYDCTNLTQIHNMKENLDTSNVTDMRYMFCLNTNLTNLDISSFDTSKVTNMEGMFADCESLISLNISYFDTANVTEMAGMFIRCSDLKQIDVSNFDTNKAVNMANMFYDCSSLTQITFGENWDKEITLPTLTKPCTGWYSEPEFTNKVAEAGANYTPNGPITIYANVPPDIFVKLYTDGTLAFCSNNSQIPFKELSQDYGNIGGKEYTTQNTIPWYNQRTSVITVTFIDEIVPISTANWFMGCEKLTILNNIEKLNTKNVINMYDMFNSCTNLTSLDVSNFDTSNVTNMYGMFTWCTSLISLNLSNFDTRKVTDMNTMFSHCTSLTKVDLSNFNTSNVTNMINMFYNCSFLDKIDLSSFDTSNVTNIANIFTNCSSLTQITFGENWNKQVTLPIPTQDGYTCSGWYSDADFTNKVAEAGASYNPNGKITIYAQTVQNIYATLYTDGTLGFASNTNLITGKTKQYGPWNISNQTGNMPWNRYSENVKTVEFVDKIQPISTAYWFSSCTNLTQINHMKENLDTSNSINMSQMFYDCRNLTTLDLSNFNTSSVTDMSYMLDACSGLTTLDVSNFDTSNVTNMGFMFSDCRNLTTLDLSSFNTKNVVNMRGMFANCFTLDILDLSSFNTSNVTDMYCMFQLCTNLTTLDLSCFNTGNVVSMNYMFQLCTNLTTLDISNFDTNNVTSMYYMFSNCTNLKSIDVSSFDTSNVTDIANIFNNCSSLTQITFGENWNKQVTLPTPTQDGYTCTGWYSDAEFTNKVAEAGASYNPNGKITIYAQTVQNIYATLYTDGTLGFASNTNLITGKTKQYGPWNISNQTGNVPWSSYRTSIKTVEFVDKIQPISTAYWFNGCTNLTQINHMKENLDTSSVTDMSAMFSGCYNLIELDLSNFDTSKVTNMNYMFSNCSSLTSLDLSNFNTSKVTDMQYMFNYCSSLTLLDLSNFDTSNVTNMECMFNYCSKLTTLDVSNFDTSNVTNMYCMFCCCSELTSLDLSNFNTSNITNMNSMFIACRGLTSLDLSNFNTSNVTDMTCMFQNCSNLKTIYVGANWKLATNRTDMFTNCGTSTTTRK